MTKVKLCGLTRPCDIAWANEVKADYVGFVFAGTKRRISDDKARYLRRLLADSIPAVGVFVNDAADHAAALARQEVIQIIQLHGQEDDTYIEALRKAAAVPIIKAFSIKTAADAARADQSRADYVLLDSGSGGTGRPFDWDLARMVRKPYFLAGGLHAGNVAVAVAALHPYAVDVSSGIESGGVKNENKIRQFMMQARQALYRRE